MDCIVSFLDTLALARFGHASHMCSSRTSPSLRDLNWFIYTVGGGGGTGMFERYSVRSDAWHLLAPFPLEQPFFASAVEFHGYIYVFADRATEYGSLGTKVARYDRDHDRWDDMGTMPSFLDDAGFEWELMPRQAVVLRSFIYVVGAHESDRESDCLARYSLSGTWQLLKPMPSRRQGIKLVVVGSLLYVIGGSTLESRSQYVSTSDVLECYNPEVDEWETLPSLPRLRGCRDYVDAYDHPLFLSATNSTVIWIDYEGLCCYYDTIARLWAKGDPMPAHKECQVKVACSHIIDGAVYVLTRDILAPSASMCLNLMSSSGKWKSHRTSYSCRASILIAIEELACMFAIDRKSFTRIKPHRAGADGVELGSRACAERHGDSLPEIVVVKERRPQRAH